MKEYMNIIESYRMLEVFYANEKIGKRLYLNVYMFRRHKIDRWL